MVSPIRVSLQELITGDMTMVALLAMLSPCCSPMVSPRRVFVTVLIIGGLTDPGFVTARIGVGITEPTGPSWDDAC